MRIKEAILLLEIMLEEHGDLEIVTLDDFEDGTMLSMDKTFEIIQVAETEEGESLGKFCAMMDPIDDNDLEPIPDKPKLTVVK